MQRIAMPYTRVYKANTARLLGWQPLQSSAASLAAAVESEGSGAATIATRRHFASDSTSPTSTIEPRWDHRCRPGAQSDAPCATAASEHLHACLSRNQSARKAKDSRYCSFFTPVYTTEIATEEGTLSKEQVSARAKDDSPGVRHQSSYLTPSLPIVFAHGLFGFDELLLAPASLQKTIPGLSVVYWKGISDMLVQRGAEVLVTRVPMSASIEERAKALRDAIDARFPAGQEINVIGHSMGGLDARYLIAHLEPKARVRSLTTIASPHRGSTFADYMLYKVIGQKRLPMLLRLLERVGMPGGGRAFDCLTIESMRTFNENTPDSPNVHYLSWGAAFQPGWFNEFRFPHRLIKAQEVRTRC